MSDSERVRCRIRCAQCDATTDYHEATEAEFTGLIAGFVDGHVRPVHGDGAFSLHLDVAREAP